MSQLSLLTPSSNYPPLPHAWDEMWDTQTGVRPHWAHLVEGMARLAARYVSGYLETTPPVGMPRQLGADATHAWGRDFGDKP